jgi:hypothetical protein
MLLHDNIKIFTLILNSPRLTDLAAAYGMGSTDFRHRIEVVGNGKFKLAATKAVPAVKHKGISRDPAKLTARLASVMSAG